MYGTIMGSILGPVIVKSFGYGIYLVEIKVTGQGFPSIEALCEKTGIPFTESIIDDEEKTAFAIASTGHEPARYELSQISPEEWESIRTAVDKNGSKQFSDRLAMLENHKP